MHSKRASSQAAWALLTEGVTRARVESHRIQHLINRAQRLVEESEHKEHLYQIGGDIIMGLPTRIDQLNMVLDRTGLALAKMGEDFLSSRLSLSDKRMVEDAVSSAFGKPRPKESLSRRVARRYLGDQDA